MSRAAASRRWRRNPWRAHESKCRPLRPLESRHLARFRRPLSRSAWLFPRCCQSFSRFGYRFNRRWQFQLGLFRSAMVAMTQRLDASGLFFYTQLSVSSSLALVLKVFRNRFRCHGQSVAELSRSKLSTFGHLVTMHRSPRRVGMLGGLCQPNINDLTPLSLVRPVPG